MPGEAEGRGMRKVTYTDGSLFPIDKVRFLSVRKKPVLVQAWQTVVPLLIQTLEGTMEAREGDWIIRGVKGELYPCKPDIFEQTYDVVAK